MKGKNTARNPKKDELFFAALKSGLPVMAALSESGYSRASVYLWRKKDEAFDERWELSIDCAVESLEAEADRRGKEGVLEPVFYQGMQCGQIRRFSDTLLIFRLKALRPDKYRDNATVEHSGHVKVTSIKRTIVDPRAKA